MQQNNSLKDLNILNEYITKYYDSLNEWDLKTIVDIIYMTALRDEINISNLVYDLYKGILNLDKFKNSDNGNIYEFLNNKKYINLAKRLTNITVGSNGGMASIGKGEWLLSLGGGVNPSSNKPKVTIIKNGTGDVIYEDSNTTEEFKWNGGKVSIDKSGKDVTKDFNKNININDKKWVPFRKKDIPLYTEEQKQKNNAAYWKSISGKNCDLLSDNQLKEKIIHLSYEKVFEKCNTITMFNNDGKFQRFRNISEVDNYYKDKYDKLDGNHFEFRANQKNPPALYCNVF